MTDYRGGGMASMKIRQIEKDVEKMKAELEEKKKEIEKVFSKKITNIYDYEKPNRSLNVPSTVSTNLMPK